MNLDELLRDDVVDSYSVRVPTFVNVSKSTKKAVNLNIYRNLHHYHLDTQKKQFTEAVVPLLKGKPYAEQVWIHYEIFAPRRGRLDTMNVGAIVDKYFCDVLVSAGRIPDDHYGHVLLSTFSFGGVCPMDGHAIATVNILERRKPMRILLDQNDIQNALDGYVTGLNLPNTTGKVHISVNQDGEVEAEILVESEETLNNHSSTFKMIVVPPEDENEDKEQPTKRRGRPKGSKNKPKEDDVDASESTETSSDTGDTGGTEPSEEPVETGEKEAKGGKGNLFGDSDDEESSDSPTTTSDDGKATEKEADQPVISPKKKSIFDAD